MSIEIRHMQPEDAWRFPEIHHAAHRGGASNDYRASVIEAWG
jgi:hypothetical protein